MRYILCNKYTVVLAAFFVIINYNLHLT